MERDNFSCAYWNLLSSFRVPTRPLRFSTHIEITKTQDGAYVITTLHIQASDKGTMDHSQHEGAHE